MKRFFIKDLIKAGILITPGNLHNVPDAEYGLHHTIESWTKAAIREAIKSQLIDNIISSNIRIKFIKTTNTQGIITLISCGR